jgi:hypothetical protein
LPCSTMDQGSTDDAMRLDQMKRIATAAAGRI